MRCMQLVSGGASQQPHTCASAQAGKNDGSHFVRRMTPEELMEQEKQAKERARKEFETGTAEVM